MFHGAYDGIPFRVCQVEQYAEDVVLDPSGVQGVYRHVEAQLTVTLNPATLGRSDLEADDMEPETAGPLARNPGPEVPLPLLYLQAKARFEAPRRPLVLWAYYQDAAGGVNKVVFLRAPLLKNPRGAGKRRADYFDADALYGPALTLQWSKFEAGGGSLILGLIFQANVPLANLGTDAPVLVSNRWSCSVTTDEDFFAKQVIEGDAVFRSDLLLATGLKPDMMRWLFIPPVPLGFKRVSATPTFAADGVTAHYEIEDVEQQTDKPGVAYFGASRVEVIHQKGYTQPSDWEFLNSITGK